MKWYKKQLDQIKKAKLGSDVSDEKDSTGKSFADNLNFKKIIRKNSFPNPVAASNKSRPKTDSK